MLEDVYFQDGNLDAQRYFKLKYLLSEKDKANAVKGKIEEMKRKERLERMGVGS
jgi:hypothetical protein